jgi:hypothetical protein
MCHARMTEVISPLERLLFLNTVIQFTAILYRIGGYTLLAILTNMETD